MSARWLSEPPDSSCCLSSVVARFSSCRYEMAFTVRSRSSSRRLLKVSTSSVLMRALPFSLPLRGGARSRRAGFRSARRACLERRDRKRRRSYALGRRACLREGGSPRRSRGRPPAARRRGPSRPRRAARRPHSFARPAKRARRDELSRGEFSRVSGRFRSRIALIEDVERALELRADARRARGEPLSFGARDLAGGRVGFLHDDGRLLLRSVAQLCGRALGRDERLAEQGLELAIAHEVFLQLLDAVGEVGALAPDFLEAVGDLEQQPLGRTAAVAAERTALQPHMADFDRGDRHYWSLSRIELTILAPMISAKTATIGERSSGPNGGRMRRKTRRYGSQTS